MNPGTGRPTKSLSSPTYSIVQGTRLWTRSMLQPRCRREVSSQTIGCISTNQLDGKLPRGDSRGFSEGVMTDCHQTPRTRLTPEFRPVRNGCPVGSVAALLPIV